MANTVHLKHEITKAEIEVPVGFDGKPSPSYRRAGWHEFTPPPPKPKTAPQAPAEPVNTEPDTAPVNLTKE